MSKILVTGAGGYIGRHVVKKLCDKNYEVLAIDRVTEGIDDRAQKIEMDIFSGKKSIYQEVGSPDICIHMAWKDGFVHNSDAHMSMLSSHYDFLHNMIDSGLRHLVVMGTMHEIGYYEGCIDENTPCHPISMYGIAKDSLRRSMLLLAKQYNICLQWLRAYYIYGDDKKNHSIFAKLLEANEAGKKIFPFNTGKNKYDFIHVEKLAEQIASVACQTQISGIINCCSGYPVSLAEKVESFIKEHDLKIKLEYGVYPDRPYDSPAVWGDSKKIERIMKSSK